MSNDETGIETLCEVITNAGGKIPAHKLVDEMAAKLLPCWILPGCSGEDTTTVDLVMDILYRACDANRVQYDNKKEIIYSVKK